MRRLIVEIENIQSMYYKIYLIVHKVIYPITYTSSIRDLKS